MKVLIHRGKHADSVFIANTATEKLRAYVYIMLENSYYGQRPSEPSLPKVEIDLNLPVEVFEEKRLQAQTKYQKRLEIYQAEVELFEKFNLFKEKTLDEIIEQYSSQEIMNFWYSYFDGSEYMLLTEENVQNP